MDANCGKKFPPKVSYKESSMEKFGGGDGNAKPRCARRLHGRQHFFKDIKHFTNIRVSMALVGKY
jgi:hypothetical protein